MADLTTIIVSFNAREDLRRCLASLPSAAVRRTACTVVVDNASTDGTPAMVAAEFPDIQLTVNPTNRGFAAGNNQALRDAVTPYVLLLNPDTIVAPGAFDTMLEWMEGHPAVSACGPLLRNPDRTLQRTGVRFPSVWNIFVESLFLDRVFSSTRLFGGHKELYLDPMVPRQVDYVQGSCLLVRTSILAQVGLLDEGFFMYFEETDWCYRMKERGGRVDICPSAEVVHIGGGTRGHYDETRLLHYHRSLLRFFEKHYSRWQGFLVRPVLAVRSLIRLVVWSIIALTRPGLRAAAASGITGYLRTLPLLVRRAR
jgi:GT2 family glycosyltransferase